MDVHFTEKLIQEVRNRPVIYILNHPDYKNNIKKLQAWREIQGELNEEVAVLKAKWKNLKDTYKKFKQSRRSTSGQAAKKLSNWVWADHMRFIEPSVSLKKSQRSIDFPSANEQPNDDDNSTFTQNKEKRKQEIKSTRSSGISEGQNAQKIYRRRRKNNLNSTDRMIQYLENTRSARNTNNEDKVEVKCDGVDLLFLGYADTFKKLSKRKQVSVKFDIAKILMEAELSDLQEINPDTPESYSTACMSVLSDATINDGPKEYFILPCDVNNEDLQATGDNDH